MPEQTDTPLATQERLIQAINAEVEYCLDFRNGCAASQSVGDRPDNWCYVCRIRAILDTFRTSDADTTDDVDTPPERDLRALIEKRVSAFRLRRNNAPQRSNTRAMYSEVVALLEDDLSDGICRCERNNGIAAYVDQTTHLWCVHGRNDHCRCGSRKPIEDSQCSRCARDKAAGL